jgi:uncharacterized protein (TIGR03000 family)
MPVFGDVPGGYAQPIEAGFNMGALPGANCDCGNGYPLTGMPMMPTGDGVPRLGTPLMPDDNYPPIPNPRVPSVMPPGFENPAQPRQAPDVEVERNSTSRNKEAVNAASEPADTTRGIVEVKLPAGSKLFVEGKELVVTNGQRRFVTPPLPANKEAVYQFKVESDLDGDKIAQIKKIHVRAGATTNVDFADFNARSNTPAAPAPVDHLPEVPKSLETRLQQHALAAKTPVNPRAEQHVPTVQPPPTMDYASITVTLPEGADLYVNGTKNERTERVREFTTPRLAAGKTYQYVMKAQVTRNGLPEYQEQKIDFKAGDILALDFSNLVEKGIADRASR